MFADDPLRSFKDQSKSKKLVLGIRAVFPIFDWSRSYSLSKFRGDLISGLTIASLCIPQVHCIRYFLMPSSLTRTNRLSKNKNRISGTPNLPTWLQNMGSVSYLTNNQYYQLTRTMMMAMIEFFFGVSDSSFVPPLIYAFMGSSRDIAIGPVAVVSLLLGTLLQSEIDHTTHPVEYLRLAFTATFFAGITQATLGIFR